jgi:hypothetical protein
MGVALAIGPCLVCKQTFGFNPHRVPSSSALTGQREPICQACFAWLQEARKKKNLPPFPEPHPDAWEAIPEEEL